MSGALEEREQALARQQQALLRAERLAAVGRVSAQVAHEVRNPLSSIGLNVEMLQDALARARFATPAEADEVRALLQSVTREVDRLTETTERYLRMARSPAPALAAEDVNAIVDGVLQFAAGELARAGIRVERRLDRGAPRGAGGRGAASPGAAQPGPQRPRGDGRAAERSGSPPRPRMGQCTSGWRTPGTAFPEEARAAPVRPALHHQAARDRARAGAEPADPRGARRGAGLRAHRSVGDRLPPPGARRPRRRGRGATGRPRLSGGAP